VQSAQRSGILPTASELKRNAGATVKNGRWPTDGFGKR
jgi:hypothetical protein